MGGVSGLDAHAQNAGWCSQAPLRDRKWHDIDLLGAALETASLDHNKKYIDFPF